VRRLRYLWSGTDISAAIGIGTALALWAQMAGFFGR
jgi:hypothetical protein